MVRNTEEYDSTTISVFLKNGEVFQRKDVTPSPLGDNDNFVCFWDNNSIVTYPMEQVEKFIFHFDK